MVSRCVLSLACLLSLAVFGCNSNSDCPAGSEGCKCENDGCDQGLVCQSGLCVNPDNGQTVCGDSEVEGEEECDDGNQLDDGNGCDGQCLRNDECGNGVLEDLYEECDDGNQLDDGNGCDGQCLRNDECGNGVLEDLYEECDDGNQVDDGNGCNAECEAYFSCLDGSWDCVEVVARDLASPSAIAADEVHLYLANWGSEDGLGNYQNDGSIWRFPLAGGQPEELATGQSRPTKIAVDGSFVYWLNNGDNPSQHNGSVVRLPKQGGEPLILADGLDDPRGLFIDDTHAYWLAGSAAASSSVMRVSLDGGGVAEEIVSGVAGRGGICGDADSLFWLGDYEKILKLEKDSHAPVELWTSAELAQIYVEGGDVFFAQYDGLVESIIIGKVPVDGGANVTLASVGEGSAHLDSLTGDADYVYWFGRQNIPATPRTALFRADTEPGETLELFSTTTKDFGWMSEMVLTGTHLFWISHYGWGNTDGVLYRIAL